MQWYHLQPIVDVCCDYALQYKEAPTLQTVRTLLASDEARAGLNDLDRANMAKWLQIARIKLDNLAALMRQGR